MDVIYERPSQTVQGEGSSNKGGRERGDLECPRDSYPTAAKMAVWGARANQKPGGEEYRNRAVCE